MVEQKKYIEEEICIYQKNRGEEEKKRPRKKNKRRSKVKRISKMEIAVIVEKL